MLDYRIETFLVLCKERNYSKTARLLNITQPAVTQHIQYLERAYDTKLFVHENKKLMLTKQGKILENMAMGLSASDKRIYEVIEQSKTEQKQLKFGASQTIAVYTMPYVIEQLIKFQPGVQIQMKVDNTKHLIESLQTGDVDCIFIEGGFNRDDFEHFLFSVEPFIAVSSKPMNKECKIEDLLKETLITREEGSGTRGGLTSILEKNYLKVEDFHNYVEIGNIAGIKELVKQGVGISFLYKLAVEKELQSGQLYEIPLGIKEQREFNFVILKNHMFKDEFFTFYEYVKEICEQRDGRSNE